MTDRNRPEDLLDHLTGAVFATVFPNPDAVSTAQVRRALGRVLSAYTVVGKPELVLTTAQYAALCDFALDLVRRQIAPGAMTRPLTADEFRALLESHFGRFEVVDD